MPKKTIYITTSIPYANAAPHVGFALEIVQADVLARVYKQLGHDVRWQTGTDVHGQKMERTAAEKGMSTADFAERNSDLFYGLRDTLDLSFDEFVRTYEPRHHVAAQAMWKLCEKDIYKKAYVAWYCVGCERFLTEKEIVDGMCTIHKKPVERVEEENYFFALSKYQEQIKALLQSRQVSVQPASRANELMTLIEEGLEDVSISRPKEKLQWGIEVPGDPSHVMYVWFDALTNYLTGLGFPDTQSALYQKYWHSLDARRIHVIGKDILRQHAVLWVGMLLSAGLETPTDIFVHGHITINGEKMSKSLGNVLSPVELADAYGKDALRYYLMTLPSGEDGDFSLELLKGAYSSLANDVGNLMGRVSNMAQKYGYAAVDRELHNVHADVVRHAATIEDFSNVFQIHRLATYLIESAVACNALIDIRAPWALAKQENGGVDVAMKELIESVLSMGRSVEPLMPGVARRVEEVFGKDPIEPATPYFPRLDAQDKN